MAAPPRTSVLIRLDPALLGKVDAWASRRSATRNAFLAWLIDRALAGLDQRAEEEAAAKAKAKAEGSPS